jgi:hypothetical protein
MAIKANVESTFGASFKDAYHKIISANLDYVEDRAIFRVAIYTNNQARLDNKTPFFIKKIIIENIDDTLGVRKKLYAYLKTLSDYSESEDI